MRWQVGSIEIYASRVFRPMFRGVPSPFCQIEAADECDGIINHYDLCVVRGSDGMISVQLEMDA